MKPDRISYQKLFPLGMYINERIGIEAQLDPGDDPETSMQSLKKMVEGMSTNPNYGVVHELQPIPEIQSNGHEGQTPEEKRITDIVTQINLCSTVEVLKSFYLIAKRDARLESAYNKKMDELP